MTSIYPDLDLIAARTRLLAIVREKAYKEGRFTLASGKISDFYLDCRLVTLDPEGLQLFSRLICAELEGSGVVAVGGLTMGADPIAAGVAVTSQLLGKPVRAFIVRKEAKQHGTAKQIEGTLNAGDKVAIVDDVMTSGGSLKTAAEAVEKAGGVVERLIVLVDRKEGGEEVRAKYDVSAVFGIDEVRRAPPKSPTS